MLRGLNGDLFYTFWSYCPKKKSKGNAEKAWSKLKPDDVLLNKMLAAIERAKATESWMKDDYEYNSSKNGL